MLNLIVDSSVVIRLIDDQDVRHAETYEALDDAATRGLRFTVVAQVVAECWSVLSRPQDANGVGYTPSKAKIEINAITTSFPVISDPANIGIALAAFAEHHQVSGRQIHDAKLALTCELLGLDGIITYNKPDFARYTAIRALESCELS